MDTKHKQNLIITIIFTLLVGSSLYFLYDNFKFHTYGDVTYYDYLLAYSNDDLIVSNYEIHKNRNTNNISGATITIKNPAIFIADSDVTIEATLIDDQNKKVTFTQVFHYNTDSLIYQLDTINEKSELSSVLKAKIKIINNSQNVIDDKFKLVSLDALYASNKIYRIEDACISDYYMRLGYLTTTDKKIIKEYSNISLEYRYLKDEKGDVDDDNNYIVFKKINGKTKDYINTANHISYIQDEKNGSLKKKHISVVIILSKDDNEKNNYAFKMEFSNETGDVNE